MAVDIDSLQIEIEATSSDAASKIDQLATALTNLKSAAKGGAGLTTTTKQLQALSNAAKLINRTNLNSQKIQQFSSAMNSLSAIQKASGLNSTINALKKLPEISTALDKADLGKFAKQMNQVASAMRPLATEMQKVANGFSAFPIRIQKIIQSNSALTASNNKTAKSFGVLGTGISSAQAKFGIYLIAFRQIASVMSNWVKESNDYVENLNLFTVAMGDYAEEAKAYAEEVQSVLGIDPSEWMRNQGVFMQMASGFGVVTDQAALMSKNLTQLGYDISSFYNIGIEESMEKLQSGLAGEIEPLRRLGYAIDVASLERVALNHGITESVNAMTQAEKAQLRYIAIMEQSTNAMGDLARTSQTPANAMRILNQQITQLSRALGNLLIPILQQIIPWVQAFVEVITEAIQALAVFFGFELPTIDYSGLDGVSVGASEAEDAIGGATDAAKKMKRELLGIDELTILEPNASSGAGGAGGVGGVGGGLKLDLPEYDFLGGLTDQANELKDTVKDLLYNYIIPVGTALAAWKILDLLQSLGVATLMIGDLKKSLVGGIVAYIEFQLVKGSFDSFLSDDGTILDLVKAAIYTALGSSILYAMFGAGGLIVGLGVSLVASIISLTSAIGNGLDYNGLKANIMKAISSGLGGAIGLIAGGATGGVVGLLITAGITFTITSIMANLSGQAESGTLENAINILLGGLASGVGGAALAITLGVAGGPVGFVVGALLSFAIQGITMNWDEITSWAKAWWNELTNNITSIWEDGTLSIPAKITEIGMAIVEGILTGMLDALAGIGTWLYNNLVSPIVSGVKSLLGINSPSKVFMEIGANIISGLLEGITSTWNLVISFFAEAMPNWWNNNIAPWFTLERWNSLVSTIGTSIKNIWSSTVGTWATNISSWWNNNVAPWFTLGKWTSVVSSIGASIKTAWDNTVKTWATNISEWWEQSVKPWFSLEKWKKLGASALEGLFSGLSNIGNKIRTWGGNLVAGVKNFFGIHSPSTLFRDEVGFNIGIGISEGIGDSERSILSEISRVGGMMRSALTISDMSNTFSVEQSSKNIQEITGAVAVRNDISDSDNGSLDVVNAIYAMASRIVTAIEENGGDVYMDGDKVGEKVTSYQNRKNRMYGKTLQYI